jgi:methionyl-tRNA formyltransferase
MRIVFAGTPEFAVPCCAPPRSHHEVVAVYTQPDRPAGRGRGLTPSPVKLEAVARGIPVYSRIAAQARSAAGSCATCSRT